MWSSVPQRLSTDTLWGAVPLSTSPTSWSTAVGSKFLSTHLTVINMKLVFSSPEQKEQVSNLSVVHRHRRHHNCCCCYRCCKLFTFLSSSPEPQGQFQPNLAQSILGLMGFKFVQRKSHFLSQGE